MSQASYVLSYSVGGLKQPNPLFGTDRGRHQALTNGLHLV